LLLLLLLLLLLAVTNPDMLHQSVLPFHGNFSRLLAKLAYVVVDEGHAYRCNTCRSWICAQC
jgi:CRISPR/Cas system-associated endonuclease/helicase Cas3